MLSLAQLIPDVENSAGRRSGEDRARTLGRLTDLFVGGADSFTAEQIELFDLVIQRFATSIETRARVELAEKLARLANAPSGIVLALARDEIVVARPILAASARLDDQSLMQIAIEKGRDHMLAICDRPTLSAAVTDVLVRRGDGVVRHAVVGNPGASFSMSGVATLVNHSRTDAGLGQLLSERGDLPADAVRQLVDMAKETARTRLLSSLPGAEREIAGAIERGAVGLSGRGAPDRRSADRGSATDRAASEVVKTILEGGAFAEADLARFAGEGRMEETLGALASMTGLSLPCLERIFEERDNDLVIVIGKARGWSWPTVQALLRLRDPSFNQRHVIRRAEETFQSLAAPTASRVVHFLKVRDTAPIRSA